MDNNGSYDAAVVTLPDGSYICRQYTQRLFMPLQGSLDEYIGGETYSDLNGSGSGDSTHITVMSFSDTTSYCSADGACTQLSQISAQTFGFDFSWQWSIKFEPVSPNCQPLHLPPKSGTKIAAGEAKPKKRCDTSATGD